MKFRIMTDGERFRIEAKRFLSWGKVTDTGYITNSGWFDSIMFTEKKQAVKFIREKYGSCAYILPSPWRPA